MQPCPVVEVPFEFAGASYVVLSAVGRARNDARKLMSGSGAHENLNTFATVSLGAGVRETIRQHIRIHPDRDVGGALVGRRTGTSIEVAAVIPGFTATGPGDALAVSAASWRAVRHELQRYPLQEIVGWYRSQRASGRLLNAQDFDIHRRFFSESQIGLMIEEPGERETWFTWQGDGLVTLSDIEVIPAPGRETSYAMHPAGGSIVWAQRAACVLIGLFLGTLGWFTVFRNTSVTRSASHAPAHVQRHGAPAAHPSVVEPQAGVQPVATSGSTSKGR